MSGLIHDTLFWFAGFIGIALGLLCAARLLTRKTRPQEQTLEQLRGEAEIARATIDQAGEHDAALRELFEKPMRSGESSGTSTPLVTHAVFNRPPRANLQIPIVVIICGSLAGGLMWTFTSEPRSWMGTMIGLAVATTAGFVGFWFHSRRTEDDVPAFSRAWADMLDLLALRWTGAGPQREMLEKISATLESSEPALAACLKKSATVPFQETLVWKTMTGGRHTDWPEKPSDQARLFQELAGEIRRSLSFTLRDEAARVGRRMNFAIWLFLAPALYLVLMTPPIVEMVNYFSPPDEHASSSAPDSKPDDASKIHGE